MPSARARRAAILVLVLCTPTGCEAPAEKAVALSPGMMVVGRDAAWLWGFRVGDTLPELSRTHIAAAIDSAAQELARDFEWRPACTRFFGDERKVIALFGRACPMGGGSYPDQGHGFAGIGRRGEVLTRLLLGADARAAREWCPALRDSSGRPMSFEQRVCFAPPSLPDTIPFWL